MPEGYEHYEESRKKQTLVPLSPKEIVGARVLRGWPHPKNIWDRFTRAIVAHVSDKFDGNTFQNCWKALKKQKTVDMMIQH